MSIESFLQGSSFWEGRNSCWGPMLREKYVWLSCLWAPWVAKQCHTAKDLSWLHHVVSGWMDLESTSVIIWTFSSFFKNLYCNQLLFFFFKVPNVEFAEKQLSMWNKLSWHEDRCLCCSERWLVLAVYQKSQLVGWSRHILQPNTWDINTRKSTKHWTEKWWQAYSFTSQTVLHSTDIAMHLTAYPFLPLSGVPCQLTCFFTVCLMRLNTSWMTSACR